MTAEKSTGLLILKRKKCIDNFACSFELVLFDIAIIHKEILFVQQIKNEEQPQNIYFN